jgi:hypothetical protein
MKATMQELVIVALLIGYVAFYTHPAPRHIQDFLSSPVGTVVALGGVLAVTMYKSLLVGVFMAIAFVMTVGNVTEYLDPKEQKPAQPEQPKSAGVPKPEVSGLVKALMKGDMRLPQQSQKKGTPPVHSKPPVVAPKAAAPVKIENFASF